jgi:peptide/nickel transport system permease protein
VLPPLVSPNPWAVAGRPFEPPGGAFLLGTDMLGRDVGAMLLHGTRFSLIIGVGSMLAAVAIGITLGALAGYAGGWVDDLLMRITEFFQILPNLVLILVLVAFMGPSVTSVIVGIGVVSWPNVARIMRAEVMSLRHREYVEAARTIGQRPLKILVSQILPNAMPPVIVVGSLMVASAILSESALSFLGLGDPKVMTWGYMIGISREFLRNAWWISLFPGLAIIAAVLAINFVGDGLAAALNPRIEDGK